MFQILLSNQSLQIITYTFKVHSRIIEQKKLKWDQNFPLQTLLYLLRTLRTILIPNKKYGVIPEAFTLLTLNSYEHIIIYISSSEMSGKSRKNLIHNQLLDLLLNWY